MLPLWGLLRGILGEVLLSLARKWCSYSGFFRFLLVGPVFVSVYWLCPCAGRQSLSLLLQRK
ncbi:protein of unknown function (plasmid) [Caballeronia sp. S22]